MAWETQPQCEACWIEEQGVWVDVGGDAELLDSVRTPTRISDVEVELCGTCEKPTISGIYVRKEKKDA